MKKISKQSQVVKATKPERSVGLDLGDRLSTIACLTREGEVMEEGRMANKRNSSAQALC